VEATKTGSPDVTNLRGNFVRGQTFGGPTSEGCFQHVLVDRFLTRVGGQREVGEENEAGHRRADEFVRECLVVMHESGDLWVRIRKIESLIFHEAEVFQDFEMGLFGIFVFEPFP